MFELGNVINILVFIFLTYIIPPKTFEDEEKYESCVHIVTDIKGNNKKRDMITFLLIDYNNN